MLEPLPRVITAPLPSLDESQAREHLRIAGRLMGVPSNQLEDFVTWQIVCLRLSYWAEQARH